MSDFETIKNRVRKLLALSKSNNENEAAAALMKANYLIAEYELDESALKFEEANIRSTKRYVCWRTILSNAVSWLYGCYKYKDTDGTLVFIGEPLHVFMASEMYLYLVKTVERIAKKSIRKNAKYAFRQSFKAGMADRIYDRLFALGQSCSWTPQRSSMQREAEEYVKRILSFKDPKKRKKPPVNKKAFNRGSSLADDVSLARQTGYTAVSRIAGKAGAVQGEL
jgi:hypothetical protein